LIAHGSGFPAKKLEVDAEGEYRRDPHCGKHTLFAMTGEEQVDAEEKSNGNGDQDENVSFAYHESGPPV
jgi:hypothetical protein